MWIYAKNTWLREQVTLWLGALNGMSPPYKFGGYRYRISRDMFLVCLVIKQDLIIPGSGDYNDRSTSS